MKWKCDANSCWLVFEGKTNKNAESSCCITGGMQLPRLLLLTTCTYCIVHHCRSFELPKLDDIAQIFGDLVRKVRSTSAEGSGAEVTLEDDEAQMRSKRQTSNIGDESPHPYEIRASRSSISIHLCIHRMFMTLFGEIGLWITNVRLWRRFELYECFFCSILEVSYLGHFKKNLCNVM